MAALGLVFDILARDRASAEIDRVSDSLGRAAKAGSFFGTLAGNVVAKGFGLLADGAKTAVGQIGDVVGKAADLSETMSKSKNIFGDQAASILTWSETAARSFGLSQAAALAATAQYGDMFIQLGFTKDAAAGLSTGLVKTAADLGSFHNVDPTDVLERIGGALRGEYDSLQQLIPNISAARVEQEALNLTHKKSAGDLSSAEKAVAALTIVQRDGASAANDFAETSGGLANQQRILGAQLDDLRAKIGTALLPIMTRLATYVNDNVVPAVSLFVTQMQDGTGRGGEFVEKMKDLAGAAQSVGEFLLPIMQFLVDHGEIFTSVAIGAVAFATALKAQAVYGVIVARFMPGLAVSTAATGTAAAGAAVGVGALNVSLAAAAASAARLLPLLVNIQAKSGDDIIKGLGPEKYNEIRKYLDLEPISPQHSPGYQVSKRLQDNLKSDDPKVAARARAELAKLKEAATPPKGKAGPDIGKGLMAGIADGISAGAGEAQKAATEAAQKVVDAISDRFQKAKSRLEALVSQSLQLRQSVTSALQQGTSLADVFSGDDLNANGAFGKQNNFGRVQAFLQKRVAMLRKFVLELRALMKRGLDPSLVAQIAQAGVDGGHRIAEAILSGGSGAIGTVNTLERQIASLANTTGKSVADDHFAKQIAEQRHTTEVLGKKLDQANAYLKKVSTPSKSSGSSASVANSLVTTGLMQGL